MLYKPGNDHINLEWSSGLTYNDDKSIKFEGFMKGSSVSDLEHKCFGDVKFVTTIHDQPPVIYEDNWNYEPNGDRGEITRKTSMKCGDEEITIIIDSLKFHHDYTSIQLNGKATTPYEKMHNIDFTMNHEVRSATSLVNVNFDLFLFNSSCPNVSRCTRVKVTIKRE